MSETLLHTQLGELTTLPPNLQLDLKGLTSKGEKGKVKKEEG